MRIKNSIISFIQKIINHYTKQTTMKKFLLTSMAAIGIAASANAQLTEGSLFPYIGGATGELTAVNAPFIGQQFNFDSISNAGYTIFIDISATWCNPCWNYHSSKQLDTLWAQHGPTGMPGVNASTTNDVYVFFVQGESTSNLAELYAVEPPATAGSASVETPYNTTTQGNWVAGTPFPMIDDTTSSDPVYGTNAIDAAWQIAYFPTVYMVCRDHLVHVLTQPTYTAAYAAAQAGCPSTAPATGSSVDAKAAPYMGAGYYACTANPAVSFQNYSTSANISAATITVTDGSGATVATVPWTGTLAPYALANVNVPSFPGTTFGGYKYNVAVTGDINPANNSSVDSAFKIYTAGNAANLPFTDNLTSGVSYKYTPPADGSIFFTNSSNFASGCPNPAGVTESDYIVADFYDFQAGTGSYDFVIGNYNTALATGLTFTFDQAYGEYTGTTTDVLNVVASADCGNTWNTLWTGSGSTLSTAAASTNEYIPAGASDWQLRTVNIPFGSASEGTNMILKFTGTSAYGNLCWMTNLSLTSTNTSVKPVNSADFISVTPNPAKDMTYVNMTVNESTTVKVEVYDAVGRVVTTVSQDLTVGAQKIAVSTSDLVPGLYYVKISSNGNVTTQPLSVIK